MINFLIDNIFIEFGGRIFQQTVGILMGTSCAPLIVDLFLYMYSCETDVLSLNDKNFSNCVHLIHPVVRYNRFS